MPYLRALMGSRSILPHLHRRSTLHNTVQLLQCRPQGCSKLVISRFPAASDDRHTDTYQAAATTLIEHRQFDTSSDGQLSTVQHRTGSSHAVSLDRTSTSTHASSYCRYSGFTRQSCNQPFRFGRQCWRQAYTPRLSSNVTIQRSVAV